MRRNDSGKYILETKLRTWTQLKAEQEAAAAADPELALQRSATQKRLAEGRRKYAGNWGCSGGCSYGKDIGFHVVDVEKSAVLLEKTTGPGAAKRTPVRRVTIEQP